jgi:dTDP-4-dehydrorhamnose 3,5-epimerase
MIDGVYINELKQFVDERGKVMHMLRSDSSLFSRFGEVYFSVINPGVVKAWKKHSKMTQHIAVPVGRVRLVIYDDRRDSRTYGSLENIETGEDMYLLAQIPPLVWYGFKNMSPASSLIANCTDLPHSPEEVEQIDSFDKRVPFDWDSI